MPFWRTASAGLAGTEASEPTTTTTTTTTTRPAAAPSSSDELQQRLQRLHMWRPVTLA